MKTKAFIVVNDNPKTVHPANGSVFPGPFCNADGTQTKTPRHFYWSSRGAYDLARALNTHGPEGLRWWDARPAKNLKTVRQGKYRVAEVTITVKM